MYQYAYLYAYPHFMVCMYVRITYKYVMYVYMRTPYT